MGLVAAVILLGGAQYARGQVDDARSDGTGDPRPRVVIEASVKGPEAAGGAVTKLAARAKDGHGRALGDGVEWRSDRVGLLGHGASLDVWLPLGVHDVSAVLVDDAGRPATVTREVHVRMPLLLNVNTTEDVVDGACDLVHCSLREAIVEANATLGPDVVTMPAGVYRLSQLGVGELASLTGDLNILDELVLQGAGANETVIEAAGIDRVMSIGPVAVTVRDLTVRGGVTIGTASTSAGAAGLGGGIHAGADSTVLVDRCAVVGSLARLEGTSGGKGGGLFVDRGADVQIVDSTIADNQTEALPMSNSSGGGLYVANGGVATVTNSTIAGNASRADGGVDGSTGSGAHVERGGVLLLIYTTVADNPPAPVDAAAAGAVLGETGADLRWAGSLISGRCELGSLAVSMGGSVESPDNTCGLNAAGDQPSVSITALDLGPLVDNGGTTATMLPGPESVAIDGADDRDCPLTDQRGAARPRDGDLDGIAACDAGAVERPEPAPATTLVLTSIGEHDGWVRESAEGSGVGGRFSTNGKGRKAIQVGDDRQGRAWRAVLSFDTALIPLGATLESVTVRLRRGRVSGDNPFDAFGACQVTTPGGVLGASPALAADDFVAIGSARSVGKLTPPPADGDWSEASLAMTDLTAIDRDGVTQFGLVFETDTDDDRSDDLIGFYSGDTQNEANRPQLVVTYRE